MRPGRVRELGRSPNGNPRMVGKAIVVIIVRAAGGRFWVMLVSI